MQKKYWGIGLFLHIILIVLSSWLLIHIFAVFGIFLALAYPLWWLFAPQKTVCLLCRAQKEGSLCPFCRRNILKREGVSPQNITSAVCNGFLLLIFSLVSIGCVYIESQIFFTMGFPELKKTASFVSPEKAHFRIGEIFTMKIALENIDNPINAIQADLGFDPEKLEVVDISTKDSFANVFIEKEINNTQGWARLIGGVPNPGWIDHRGTFGVVYFKAKNPGIVTITFLPSSAVLTNDGRGSNILKQLPDVSYVIATERISDEETQKQAMIFSNKEVLGASTYSGQMNFYQQKSVLGTQTKNDIETKDQTGINIMHYIGNTIAAVDNGILIIWKKAFNAPREIHDEL